MNSLGEIFRRRRLLHEAAVDFPQSNAEEEARFAREKQLYSLEDSSAIDGLGLMKALMIFRSRPIAKYFGSIGKRYSMLHPDALVLLHYLAKNTAGNILEIGPYIGGSTIAIAQGVRASGKSRSFSTIEAGGASSHPTVSSLDILSDLKRNLAQNGVADLVEVIAGDAQSEATKGVVRNHLQPGSLDLLVMDADGAVQQAFDAYRAYLGDRCWVVIDDYYATGVAIEKALRSKAEIDSLVRAGELETCGFFGWGTWVGRWLGPRANKS